jgi:hypothetical protein
MLSLFAHLFVAERHRQRAGEVGFAVPAFSEIEVGDANIEPLLATNMRGTFLRTRVARQGYARFGFSECPIEAEGKLLGEFYRVLVWAARHEQWQNLTSSEDQALTRIRELGFMPKIVVRAEGAPESAVPEGVYKVVADLPPGASLVVAPAPQAGLYTRVGEHMGLLAYHVDRAFVAVLPP